MDAEARTPAAVKVADRSALERRVVSKVSWRLLPYLFLLYVIAYIDRINVGVAKAVMSEDLGIDPEIFGAGAGIFFIGYFIFEVPSNLVLTRVEARIWIARIMVFWGIITVCMMFVKGVASFYTLRFLLGVAEAGFFPGILFYMTRWFRAKDRARAISLFMTAGTLAGAFGNPLSGSLLLLDGVGGLKGWHWLFVIEGVPAILLGFSVLFLLTESPEKAKWLSAEESSWLRGQLAQEQAGPGASHGSSLLAGLSHPTVWHLTGLYFLLVTGAYGFEFWLPTIVKGINRGSDFQAALLSAIPYLVGTVVMVVVGHNSDRTGERRGHVSGSMLVASAAFFASTLMLKNPVPALAVLSIAWAGLKAAQGPFWAIPPAFLKGTAAAGGIALINSVGNLGGYLGPRLAGKLEKTTGSYTAGLLLSASCLLCAGLLTLTLRPPAPARSPDVEPALLPGQEQPQDVPEQEHDRREQLQ
jgi:ACS family tartrate transporter-like MFS transporter